MKSKDLWNLHLGNTTCIYCGVLPSNYHTPDCPSHSPYDPEEIKGCISPDHYKLPKGLEVIDLIKFLLANNNFTSYEQYCYGSVIKYVLRCGRKDSGLDDLRKAKKFIEFLLKEHE